ncbi:hypothetical protein N0V93_001358 [Gnomoniopsis smithogilvyi]|uniref:superoxide dismutase n=1 Tax=Gnomoniopsis smithogilvyi TaxID=1191159 RepID=A0A9W8Z1Y5_9PEZI|nr:hypothetical protein N0V93_001358 [Gnomoniopsis smithogilvyi]
MHLYITTFSVLAAWTSSAVAQKQEGNYTTGILGNASIISDNPIGASFIATLPDTAFDKAAYPDGGNVKGSIQAVSMPNGEGVMFHVNFSNLPSSGGPFLYHIHDQPVPDDGNCTATLAHLDPYQRGETPACDPTIPETCQVGDLAGKHGKVEVANSGDTFNATYVDNFASTLNGIGAYFGNRSFVFHFANTTRITCANFKPVKDSASACSATTTTTSASSSVTSFTSTTSTTTKTTSTSTGRHNTTTTSSTSFVTVAAAHTHAAKAMVAVGAAGLAFLL